MFLSSTSRSEDWIEVQNDLSTGRYSNALERINQIQEKDFDFYTYKGLALELMGNLEEADLNYKLALEQNSTEWIYVQRVRLLLKLKKEKEAAIILENGRKKYPNSQNLLNLKDDISNKRNERYVQYHYQSAINYINLKKYDLARDELKKALNKGNNYYEIYQLFGYLDLLEKQYPSAILEYKKSIALRNNDPNLYLALYQVYSLNEQEDKAINSLIESLKYDSNNISILNRIAYYFELQSSLETAEFYYKKSLDLDSSDTFAKEGIKRIQHQQMTEFYMEYSSSRGKDRELNPGIQGNRINIRSYFLSMSKNLLQILS